MAELWIGIDPGAEGALAGLAETGEVFVEDWPGYESPLINLVEGINFEWEVLGVVIEIQQSMPRQGIASAFKGGMGYSAWITAASAMRWPILLVRPNDWKRGLGYPSPPPKRTGQAKKEREKVLRKHRNDLKNHSLALARRRYPQAATTFLTRKKDHDRAEAILMAELARERFPR